jgi:hypothetical protein
MSKLALANASPGHALGIHVDPCSHSFLEPEFDADEIPRELHRSPSVVDGPWSAREHN